jgi:hypothetical protein
VINAGEAFAVVVIDNSNRTMAHEIGHIQGCHHEYAIDQTATDNHGFVHVGNTLDSSFATVMAYGNACVAPFGERCPTIQYFSHTDLTYLGVPIGAPGPLGAINAINIMNVSPLVNGFRDYPVDLAMPFGEITLYEFAYSIAQSTWTNANSYTLEQGAKVHVRSENRIDLKPGFVGKEGSFFDGRIGNTCDPPDPFD